MIAPARRDVAVVVLTRDGREDTLACLASLRDVRWDGGDMTVVVVDNGSSDGTAAAVAAGFPEVVVVRSDENLGFAGGNNLGIAQALERGADDVVLLNNDTEVDPDFIAILQRARVQRPDAGALCPLITYAEPADLIWYAGARFDPRRGHHGKQDGMGERDTGQYASIRATERLSGCAVLLPREALEDVGAFDADLFLYYEDADLSLRIRATGRRIYVVPDARVKHKVSASSGGEFSPTIAYYTLRNSLAVCERHAPLGRVRSFVRIAETLVAHVLHARKGADRRSNLAAVREAWRDHRTGRLGPRGAHHTPTPAMEMEPVA